MSAKDSAMLEQLLARATQGDASAAARITEVVYAELRQLAHAILRNQRTNQTLCTTALVNESWMRIVGKQNVAYDSRSHFFRVAARAMRSILIDYARQRQSAKRGGQWQQSPLDHIVDTIQVDRIDLIALDEALTRLHALSPRRSQVVELRFFAGLSIAEVAQMLDVSHGTVENDWSFARTWLHRQIAGDQP